MQKLLFIVLAVTTAAHASQKPNKQAEQERRDDTHKLVQETIKELRKIDEARKKAGLPPATVHWGPQVGDNVYLG